MKRFLLMLLVLALLPVCALGDVSNGALTPQDILLMENVLYSLGYAPGPIDGHENDDTESALMEFQRDHGLPATGAADADTLDAMIRAAYESADETRSNSFSSGDHSIPVYSLVGRASEMRADDLLHAFETAYGNGVRNVAVDVFLTSDGQLIAAPNPITANPRTTTLEKLLNASEGIVPLCDLVSLYGEGASFLMTIYDSACAKACAEFFLTSQIDVLYASPNTYCLTAITQVRADARTALIADAIGFVPDLAQKAKGCGTTLILTGPGGITSSTAANMQYMGLTFAARNITSTSQAANVLALGAQFVVSSNYSDIVLLLTDPDAVCHAKQILKDVGLYAGNVNGFPDQSFWSAYDEFQKTYDLDRTEGVTEKTVAAMNEAATETLQLRQKYAGRPVLLCGKHVTSVVAHRGLTDGGAPENTIEAFQAAIDANVEWVELDVWRTADGELVCWHNQYLTAHGKSVSITSLTLSEIRSLYPNRNIPTLSEALSLFCDTGIFIIVDLKGPNTGADAAKAAMELDMTDRTVFSSFRIEYLRAVRSVCPTASLSLAVSRVVSAQTIIKAYGEDRLDMLLVQGSCAHKNVIADLQDAGFRVAVWTINNYDKAKQFAAYGADLLLTDRVSLFID